MIACSLNDSYSTRVADSETLTYLAIDIQLTGSSTIESGIACDDIILWQEVYVDPAGWQYRNTSA